jgi:hypothetical protein
LFTSEARRDFTGTLFSDFQFNIHTTTSALGVPAQNRQQKKNTKKGFASFSWHPPIQDRACARVARCSLIYGEGFLDLGRGLFHSEKDKNILTLFEFTFHSERAK